MRIDDMTIDQFIELNQYICERIDYLRDRKNAEFLMDLQTGNKVTFQDKQGESRIGGVIKKNRKAIGVITEDSVQWKLPPGLVRILKDIN